MDVGIVVGVIFMDGDVGYIVECYKWYNEFFQQSNVYMFWNILCDGCFDGFCEFCVFLCGFCVDVVLEIFVYGCLCGCVFWQNDFGEDDIGVIVKIDIVVFLFGLELLIGIVGCGCYSDLCVVFFVGL